MLSTHSTNFNGSSEHDQHIDTTGNAVDHDRNMLVEDLNGKVVHKSPIIREGLITIKGTLGRKKKEPLLLCCPNSVDDILCVMERIIWWGRQGHNGSKRRHHTSSSLSSPSLSATLAANETEAETYGHLAFASISGHCVLIFSVTPKISFIHMPDVVAIHDETVLKAACSFAIITESRKEFKFGLDTSPQYQAWMNDLLNAFDEENYANEAYSLRSYRSQRSTIRSGRSVSRGSATSNSVQSSERQPSQGQTDHSSGRSTSRASTVKSTHSTSRPKSLVSSSSHRRRPSSRSAPSNRSSTTKIDKAASSPSSEETIPQPKRASGQSHSIVLARSVSWESSMQTRTYHPHNSPYVPSVTTIAVPATSDGDPVAFKSPKAAAFMISDRPSKREGFARSIDVGKDDAKGSGVFLDDNRPNLKGVKESTYSNAQKSPEDSERRQGLELAAIPNDSKWMSKSPSAPAHSRTPSRKFTLNELFSPTHLKPAPSPTRSPTPPNPHPFSSQAHSHAFNVAIKEPPSAEPRGGSKLKHFFKSKSHSALKQSPREPSTSNAPESMSPPPMSRSSSSTGSSGSSQPNLLASLMLVPSVRVSKVESLGSMINRDLPDMLLYGSSQDSRMSISNRKNVGSNQETQNTKENLKVVEFHAGHGHDNIIPPMDNAASSNSSSYKSRRNSVAGGDSAGMMMKSYERVAACQGLNLQTDKVDRTPLPEEEENRDDPAAHSDISFDVVAETSNLSVDSIASIGLSNSNYSMGSIEIIPFPPPNMTPMILESPALKDEEEPVASDKINEEKDDDDNDSDDDDEEEVDEDEEEIITFADNKRASFLVAANSAVPRSSMKPTQQQYRQKYEHRVSSHFKSFYSDASLEEEEEDEPPLGGIDIESSRELRMPDIKEKRRPLPPAPPAASPAQQSTGTISSSNNNNNRSSGSNWASLLARKAAASPSPSPVSQVTSVSETATTSTSIASPRWSQAYDSKVNKGRGGGGN